MKFFLSFLCMTFFALSYVFGAEGNSGRLEQYKRIVVYGDSITDNQLYPLLLESFLRTRYPENHSLFWSRGWGGDQARNLKRFERDCLSLEPDCIIINLGMNDAGYVPEIGSRIDFFANNIRAMVELAKKKNANVNIILMSPVMYECQVQQNRYFYPYVLWKYSCKLKDISKEMNVKYIDMNTLYTHSTGLLLRLFPDDTVFSRDGIHPNETGQSIIALNIISALNDYPEPASVVIDVNKNKIMHTAGAQARLIENSQDELIFEQRLNALPMPLTKNFAKFAPFLEFGRINNDLLIINGLAAGFYSIAAEGKVIGVFSAAELNKGINLGMLFDSPDYKQAQEVMAAVKAKQDMQYFLWRDIRTSGDGLFPHGKSISEKEPELQQYHEQIQAAREKIYQVNKPQSQRFVVKKLKGRWSDEKNIVIEAAPVVVEDKSNASQDVSIKLKNLTGKTQVVKLEVPDKIEAMNSECTLEPFEDKVLTLKSSLNLTDAAPLLKISYKPEDDSFPLIKERIQLRIKPSIKVFPVNKSGKRTTIDLDYAKLSTQCRREWKGKNDLLAKAELSWDNKYFYLKITVNDQFHINRYSGSKVHRDDNIQLAFYFPERKAARHFEYGLTLTDKGAEAFNWRGGKKGLSDNVLLKVDREAGKTIYDAAFPWRDLAVKDVMSGFKFGFSFGVNDRDSDESWKYIAWTDGIWYGKNPENFGILELQD